MSERARFTSIRHVHCLHCGQAAEIEDGTDKDGYYVGKIAEHECREIR